MLNQYCPVKIVRFFASLRMTSFKGDDEKIGEVGGTASNLPNPLKTINCHSERNEVKRRISFLFQILSG
jgi:hypothetical protein